MKFFVLSFVMAKAEIIITAIAVLKPSIAPTSIR